jgi:hypothetical protein
MKKIIIGYCNFVTPMDSTRNKLHSSSKNSKREITTQWTIHSWTNLKYQLTTHLLNPGTSITKVLINLIIAIAETNNTNLNRTTKIRSKKFMKDIISTTGISIKIFINKISLKVKNIQWTKIIHRTIRWLLMTGKKTAKCIRI